MSARFDKYDPLSGGFRARLGFAPSAGEVGDVIPVYVNGSGVLIKSTALLCDGVIVLSRQYAINDVVDVMTAGEIVDIVAATDNVAGAAIGAMIYAAAAGATTVTAPTAGTNGIYIGKFVEAWRLIVRVDKVQG